MTKQNGNDLLTPSIEDIDMIVFDVDGTLMDRDGMPPGMVGLMKETESRGVTISLASGRTLPNLTPIHQALGLSGFIIAENGGVLWDGPKGQKIELRANGDRCRESIEWIATQMPEIDPLGIESNRWRKLNGVYQDLMTSMQSENCWNSPNGPTLEWLGQVLQSM